jgi:hypothetical protein
MSPSSGCTSCVFCPCCCTSDLLSFFILLSYSYSETRQAGETNDYRTRENQSRRPLKRPTTRRAKRRRRKRSRCALRNASGQLLLRSKARGRTRVRARHKPTHPLPRLLRRAFLWSITRPGVSARRTSFPRTSLPDLSQLWTRSASLLSRLRKSNASPPW